MCDICFTWTGCHLSFAVAKFCKFCKNVLCFRESANNFDDEARRKATNSVKKKLLKKRLLKKRERIQRTL